MENFWDYSVWGFFNLLSVLMGSLLAANTLKRKIPWLRASLIPTSVLGGGVLLVLVGIYRLITGEDMFETAFFGYQGTANLELLTYHTLALGFIASSFKTSDGKITKQRSVEIFNTGVTTVATYLLQAVVGFGITMIAAKVIKGFFPAAGLLLPFGYGQGTGQALNYGGIFEADFGFEGGRSFGLTIAALGFLSASIGGVIHLNILRKKGLILSGDAKAKNLVSEHIQGDDEIPMQESMDKMTVQIALIAVSYAIAFGLMSFFGSLLPGMKSVIFGFNFLLGVLAATIVKLVINFLHKKDIIHREYINSFLMTRASNFAFDIMVVAGVAAIRLSVLESYWGIMLILGVVGLIVTYIYNYIVSKVLFNYGFLFYLTIALAIGVALFFKRTRTGLNLRAVGENPATADAAGIPVTRYKYLAACAGSGLVGVAGIFCTMEFKSGAWAIADVDSIEAFGWLAVALVIFALWKPVNLLWGSLVFGICYWAYMYLPQMLGITVSTNLAQMLPYIITIIVLIVSNLRKSRENQGPASLGMTYFREER